MRIFLLKISKFFSIFIFSAFILVGGSIYLVSKNGIEINDDKNILILGDSHTECAINDSIWNNSINLSESGSTYFFSRIKLRTILETNKNIDTLLLSFHFGSLDKENESNFTFNESYLMERLPKFIPFFSNDDIRFYLKKSEFVKALLRVPIHYFKYLLNGIFNNDYSIKYMKIGAFSKSDREKLEQDIETRKKNSTIQKKINQSIIEKEMLNDISNICVLNKVKLILINTPIYNAGKYTDTSFYYKFKIENAKKFNFVDMSNKSIPQNGFGDISHLNQNGASIFTKELISYFYNNQNKSNK
jgi:hypothetical protein